ncbi:MAG: DUF4433 domain-containing protein [Desulfococcaceae bacterium]|jgi:hypothetical protein|nr:DUF4433 domain-containing protein [Desulfococcaceae bacterium]
MTSKTALYHITHVKNLSGIIKNRAIMAQSLIRQYKISYCDIAYNSIQRKRSLTPIPCGPKGYLHDYVPFYFAPRSPMLYTISKGNVEGYNEGQYPIVYLVTSLRQIAISGLRYVFTDGHGIMSLTDFFDNFEYLNEIDWEVMNSIYWNDTNENPDRKRRRQAEFLIYRCFPWNMIEMIAVINGKMKAAVEKIISAADYHPAIICKPDWYY